MRALILAIVMAPALAAAEPASIEVRDRGDYAEVIAHNVKSTKTAITPIRQRLEIPLAGVVSVKRVVPTGDPTIQLAEVDNESHVLSVKLTMERGDVRSLAKSAQAMQIGDDLHLMFPRHLPAEGQVVTLPEPTLPVIVPAPVIEPIAPPIVIDPPAKAPEKAPEKAIEKQVEAKPAAAAVAPAPAPAAKPAPLGKADDKPPAAIGMTEEPGGPLMTYGALALAALVGIWWIQRKRKARVTPVASTIDVIAQRSLGGKAKIVWLSAGGRDMVVAVTAQQVRMLGQWPRGTDKMPSVGTLGTTVVPREPSRKIDIRETREPRFADGTLPGAQDAPAPASPAIQGLMRLRQRHAPPPAPGSYARRERDSFAELSVHEDVATDDIDADALWAKEILAATNERTR